MNPGRGHRRKSACLALSIVLVVGACGASDAGDGPSTSGPGPQGPHPEWTTSRREELADAAGSGHDWLMARGTTLPPYVALLMDYLRRRFGAGIPPDLVDQARVVAAEGEGASQMRVYLRLVDPDVTITRTDLDSLEDEVDRITGPALACDQVPLPDGYLELLQRAVDLGEYERTHAVLALQWLREHDCIGEATARDLSDRWAGALVESVESERAVGNGAGDLAIEAMAMLAYSGHADRIEEDWAADVIAVQRPDGSWRHGSAGGAGSPHATVLAVWLLSELANPDTAPTPWIPQP